MQVFDAASGHSANPNNYPNKRIALISKGAFSKGCCFFFLQNLSLELFYCLAWLGISDFSRDVKLLKCRDLRGCGDTGAAPAVYTDKWEKDGLCKLGKECLGEL